MTFKQYYAQIKQDERYQKLDFSVDGREHYVYRITDYTRTEKQHYYGSHTPKKNKQYKNLIDEFWTYRTSSKKNILNENAKENYKVKILKVFDNPANKMIYESYLHQYFDVKLSNSFWNGSNQTPYRFDTTGKPSEFKKHSTESKNKMKGRIVSMKTRKKLSKSLKGVLKPKLSATMKGKSMYKNSAGDVIRVSKDDPRVQQGEFISVKVGTKASAETRNKMSLQRQGHKVSTETRNKISESNGNNIKIYNTNGVEIFYCTNGFDKFCKLHELPIGIFRNTYLNNTIVSTKFKKYEKYNGWYARKI